MRAQENVGPPPRPSAGPGAPTGRRVLAVAVSAVVTFLIGMAGGLVLAIVLRALIGGDTSTVVRLAVPNVLSAVLSLLAWTVGSSVPAWLLIRQGEAHRIWLYLLSLAGPFLSYAAGQIIYFVQLAALGDRLDLDSVEVGQVWVSQQAIGGVNLVLGVSVSVLVVWLMTRVARPNTATRPGSPGWRPPGAGSAG